MSQASVFDFFKAVQKNKAVQKQLEVAESLNVAVKIGTEQGYNFTQDELIDFIEEIQRLEAKEVEMSEEELEIVAGGYYANNRKLPFFLNLSSLV
ncbi:MAG: Nif11-like leader peptide family natural product precursor [Prochloraceae cyanobacterium]|nr:Nif11-like leader peptide family natural product precursor [Prochloraceae cyanobacterium]